MTREVRPVGYEVKRGDARASRGQGVAVSVEERGESRAVTVIEVWAFLGPERLADLSVRVDLVGKPLETWMEIGIVNHATGLVDAIGPFRIGDVGVEEAVLTQEDLPSPAAAYVDPESRRITLRLVETHPGGVPQGREERAYLQRVVFQPVYETERSRT